MTLLVRDICTALSEINYDTMQHESHKPLDPTGWVNCDFCQARFRPLVRCDNDCGAFDFPRTLDEALVTVEHYKTHSRLGGCSHGS